MKQISYCSVSSWLIMIRWNRVKTNLVFHVVIPTLLFFLASCTRPATVNVAKELAALRTADSLYSQTGLSRDQEMFVSLNAPNGVMYPPGSPVIKGRDSIRSFLKPIFNDPAFAIKFALLEIEVSQGGDMGYTLNQAELTATGPNGTPVTERFRDFHVWKKQADGSWKIAVDMWNSGPDSTAIIK